MSCLWGVRNVSCGLLEMEDGDLRKLLQKVVNDTDRRHYSKKSTTVVGDRSVEVVCNVTRACCTWDCPVSLHRVESAVALCFPHLRRISSQPKSTALLVPRSSLLTPSIRTYNT